MNLNEIKGAYDVIFSLGKNCLPADQISRRMLRKIGGVIDWVESPSLSGVSNLLRNRFANYMEFPNLSVTGINELAGCYIVRDAAYHIFSHHDFPLNANTPEHLNSYPELRAAISRRAPRFLDILQTADKILFIRTEATVHETAELLEVLRGMVRGQFNLLVVNHKPVYGIFEVPSPFPNVCEVHIPIVPNEFQDNDHIWSDMLWGFTLR